MNNPVTDGVEHFDWDHDDVEALMTLVYVDLKGITRWLFNNQIPCEALLVAAGMPREERDKNKKVRNLEIDLELFDYIKENAPGQTCINVNVCTID